MNAIQFIKEHGVAKAREELNKLPNSNVTHMTSDARMFIDENNPLLDEFQRSQIRDLICIKELKHLVESVDLIHANSGLNGTKNTVKLFQSSLDIGLYHGVEGVNAEDEIPRLKQAIADYESIYSNDMGDDSHIENHVSKNCKVIDYD